MRYMYLQPLGAPTQYNTTAVFTMDENNMPMENADNSSVDCYDVTFVAPDNAVAYELYVFDPTQVVNGTIKQVSHIYFGQDTNLTGLIYLYDTTAIENSHTVICGKSLGRQTNNIVSVSGFTLSELLGLSLNTPVTFSYVLKAWTNDYDAEGNSLGYKFNVNHAKLLGQFEYKIKLQTASISSIELVDDGDFFDVSTNGIQYLKYTSNANAIPTFKFKITMSGVYYTSISPLLNEIKRVDVVASIDRGFDLTKLSSFTINNQSVEQIIENNNAVLYITVDVATNPDYMEDMGTWIYTNLPNIIDFKVQVSYDASSVNNTTYTDIDGISKSLNYIYENSDTSASTENSNITLGKQLTTPTVELLYDNLSASGLSSVEIGGAGYETNLFDQGEKLSDFAANPYIYVNSNSTNYTWGAEPLSREAGEINSFATYSLTLSMDGKTDSIITGLTIADIQDIIAIFNNIYSYSTDPSTRYDYLSGTDIFLNNSSALYQKLMAFIGTGNGGVVRLTLQTVADSGTSNLWVTGNASNVKVLNFYARTSVITTSPLIDVTDSMFNCANSEIVTFMDRTSSATTSDVYRISTGNVIVNWQKSDYAQSYISMWTYDSTGSKVATYNYIIENTDTTSQDIVNMVSKFTNTDYFKSYPGNIWDVSNINNNNDKRGWYVITVTPIIPSSVIEEYLCGTYPSQTVTYKNKVKFVNKIDLSVDTSVSVSNNVPTLNEAVVEYTSGAKLNQTAAFLELSVNGNSYFASISTSGTLQENLTSTIQSLLNTGFGSVTSGGLFNLYFRYKTSASSTTSNPNSNIFPSNYTSAIQYKHYCIRELGYYVMQSGGALVITSYYKDDHSTLTNFNQDSLDNITFTLKQNGGVSRSTTSISTGNSSYYSFIANRADCFDYSSTIPAYNCLNGYTAYTGCIQAGVNYFEAFCDLKDEASVNNCYDIVWGKDANLTGSFIVPSEYSPQVYISASGILVKKAINLTDWDSTPEDIENGCTNTVVHGQTYLKSGLSNYNFYTVTKTADEVTWETGYNWSVSPYGATYSIKLAYSVDDGRTTILNYTSGGGFSIPKIDKIKSSIVIITTSGHFRSGFLSYMAGREFSDVTSIYNENIEQEIKYNMNDLNPFTVILGKKDNSGYCDGWGNAHWSVTSSLNLVNNTVFNLDYSGTWYAKGSVHYVWDNWPLHYEGDRNFDVNSSFKGSLASNSSEDHSFQVYWYSDYQAWDKGSCKFNDDAKQWADTSVNKVY